MNSGILTLDGHTVRLRRPAKSPANSLDEASDCFACFGATVTIAASGAAAPRAIAHARRLALDVHNRLTRFDPDSDLSRLNADPRERVPAGDLLRSLAKAARRAGVESGGLVDATCLPAVAAAGYQAKWDKQQPDRSVRPALATDWRGGWDEIYVDGECIVRPPGVELDGGGLAKGLAADLIAAALAPCETWVVDCLGDLRLGGTADLPRPVHVADPYDGDAVLHSFEISKGAIATSGTTGRAWANGHHLIDPRTGRPADTGIVQATAVAATCLNAEIRAKTALLRGTAEASTVLAPGGSYVTDHHALHIVPVKSR
jgi:thiamine biosynthesis lipoprotein